MRLSIALTLAAVLIAVAFVFLAPIPARREARRALWASWAVLAVALPALGTLAALRVVPAEVLPWWRWFGAYALLLALPMGAAALAADRLRTGWGRRSPWGHGATVVVTALATLVVAAPVIWRVVPDAIVAVQ